MNGLELAIMEHFQTSHLSALASPALSNANQSQVAAAAAAAGLAPEFLAAAAKVIAPSSSSSSSAAATTASGVIAPNRHRPSRQSHSTGPGESDGDASEVTGPLSRHLEAVAGAVAQAAGAWACWRLGLLWTHKMAEITGVSLVMEDDMQTCFTFFYLCCLYFKARHQ